MNMVIIVKCLQDAVNRVRAMPTQEKGSQTHPMVIGSHFGPMGGQDGGHHSRPMAMGGQDISPHSGPMGGKDRGQQSGLMGRQDRGTQTEAMPMGGQDREQGEGKPFYPLLNKSRPKPPTKEEEEKKQMKEVDSTDLTGNVELNVEFGDILILLEIPDHETISAVKILLHEKTGVPPSQQELR